MSRRHPSTGFVERAASELAAQGFPRMPAGVIMALTASDEGRLTAAELSQQLQVSAGAVSGAVTYLSSLGMIRSSLITGTRRHMYSLPDSAHAWYTVSMTRPGVYAHIIALLRSETSGMTPSAVRDRIDDIADFFAFIDERMPSLLAEWRDQRAARSRVTE